MDLVSERWVCRIQNFLSIQFLARGKKLLSGLRAKATIVRDAAILPTTSELFAMTPTDPTAPNERRDSRLAVGIMFFAFTLLCALLGWAEGVRHDTKVLRIPETGSWLLAAGVLAALGILFVFWSRPVKRR